jgi:hypothetical protein
LEGLEVSIVSFSGLNLADRTDAEYFSKENRAVEHALRDHDAVPLREFGKLVGSAFYPAATDLYEEGDVPFARCVDCIKYPIITHQQYDNFVRVPAWFVEQSKQIDCATRGDIIITKVGSPCYASIVHDYDRIALSRTVLGLIEIHDINPYYLTAFLRCRFGFNQLLRQREQTIQYQLTLDRVREVLVYRASPKLQNEVQNKMLAYVEALNNAGTMTDQAEQALLSALDLEDWTPPEPLTYSRRASEVFGAGRLDSQYFAPRVAMLIERLSKNGRILRDVAPPRQEKFVQFGDQAFRYIEISDLKSDGTVTDEMVPMSEAPSRATWYVRSGDVLTSTVRPNRRLTALIVSEQDGCVASSGFVVLQPKTVPPEVLLTYLRLPLFCELMDLHTSASLYPAISERDLLSLPFPNISQNASDKIVAAVRSAHVTRKRAQELLEQAKRAIEIAIEDSEAAAIKYLKNN